MKTTYLRVRLPKWVGSVVLGLLLIPGGGATAAERVLNLLCWVGYEEPSMINVFEDEYDVKVNAKTYVGGDAMFTLFTQSRDVYDVVVVDPEYLPKLHAAGRLAKLNRDDYDSGDFFATFKKFPFTEYDGDLYAVPVRFGSNGLVYNTNHLTAEDVSSYKILWDPKVKGRVGIWDWYLPSMGVLSRAVGNQTPYDISEEQFRALEKATLELRPQVAAIHPSPPEMLSALANEETWVVPAGGEWVAAILQAQGNPIDWVVPEEGGIMWSETLVIANDAPHPDVAREYIQWMHTPEAQALLTQREAYYSNVPNKKAYDLLTDSHKDILKIHNEQEAMAMLEKISVRTLPQRQAESDWQDVWERFKTGQ